LSAAEGLLHGAQRVVNIGLAAFAAELAAAGAPVVHVEWRPPDAQTVAARALLARMARHAERIARANRQGLERLLGAAPVLIDIMPAHKAMPALKEGELLHAGPPIDWQRMCGPMRGAVAGAVVFEGWAKSLEEAERLAAAGAVRFRPNHELGAVGPMAGITSRSMPVLVVENRAFGNRGYCVLNEGLGKVLRFGANDEGVIDRLRWLREEFAPAFGGALRAMSGLELMPLVARGLAMGDEMHQRNAACSALVVRETAPYLARAAGADLLARALAFIGGNEQFFLNIGMAMGKCIMDPVSGIPACSLVTAMCRNGTEFGVRLAATGGQWFTAPAELPRGLYFPGYSADDANPDMGDSAIMETIGLGGCAMAASPAVVGFVGAGRASEAAGFTRAMQEIAVARNARWTIPALDFQGAPAGLDARRIVDTGIQPVINTGIAHRRAGVGQIGAGIALAPLACFSKALEALALALDAE
jgi:hypothetical protein